MSGLSKKLLSAVLSVVLLSSLAGCGNVPSGGHSPAESFNEFDDSETASASESFNEFDDEDPYADEENWINNGGYAYYYYEQLGRFEMPKGAWCAPPTPYQDFTVNNVTFENYKKVKDVGLNSIYGLYDRLPAEAASVNAALDFCEELGLVYLVRDTSITALGVEPELITFDKERYSYFNSPAFGGCLVVDEPGTSQFWQITDLRRVFWNVNKKSKNKLMYVNLLPIAASDAQLVQGASLSGLPGEAVTYEEYLDKYIAECDPQVLSFDYYPINYKYTGNEVAQRQFTQLSVIRKKAQENGIPFWVFVCAGFYQGKAENRMTRAQFNWQISTALTYGAKGIQYFNFWQPYEITGCVNGFVDHYGEKTYLWDYGVKANEHLCVVEEILMKSANKGVIQVGKSLAPVPEEDKLTSYGSLVSAAGGRYLIGCFDARGKDAFYITSNDLVENEDLTLAFDGKKKITTIVGKDVSVTESDSLTININPGEGILVLAE